MPLLPTTNSITKVDTSLTTFTVKVDGTSIPDAYNVLSIDIYKVINQISYVRILLYDGDAAKQDFEISGGEVFEIGKSLEVLAGYHLDESPVYKGIITKQKIKIKRSGGSLLYVEARDPSFKMSLDRKSRYFKELSDADLFSQICQGYNITIDTDLAGEVHPEIVQYQVSDWDFLISRAERLGYYCFYSEDKIKIKKMSLAGTANQTYTYGVDVYDADLEMESRSQYESVVTSAWDYSKQEVLTADNFVVSAPDLGKPNGSELARTGGVSSFNIKHSGYIPQQDLDAWAEAQIIKSRFARIVGMIKIQGNPDITAGDSIELKGFGNRFNGNAFVSGIRHNIGDGNWTTTLQIGHSKEWHFEKYPVNSTPGSGFSPAINGLQIGIVTQLQDDPNSENRIMVKIPMINSEDEGTWCRMALSDAGEQRGIVWLPEIGDEVIVGFINDDPNQAVVLGMFHSSSKPSPHTATDDNHIKGIVTRGDMRITFDDEKNILSLETPNGNKISLSQEEGSVLIEDENANKVTMNSDGISMESNRDIILKAKGDVKIEGVNIKNAATAGFEAQGSASAKLSSRGTTDVKGSIVNIN